MQSAQKGQRQHLSTKRKHKAKHRKEKLAFAGKNAGIPKIEIFSTFSKKTRQKKRKKDPAKKVSIYLDVIIYMHMYM